MFGWQTCPVVVIMPEAASGTIWPLWKTSAGATSEQACKSGKKKKKSQKAEDVSGRARAVGPSHSRAIGTGTIPLCMVPHQGLEAYKSSGIVQTKQRKWAQ